MGLCFGENKYDQNDIIFLFILSCNSLPYFLGEASLTYQY